MSTHTPGAMRAATIIMGDRHCLATEYGRKTAEGLADLIDNQTAAPELLEALRKAVKFLTMVSTIPDHEGMAVTVILDCRVAIAKAEGREA